MAATKFKGILKNVFSKHDPKKIKEELNWADNNILGKIPENDRPVYGIYGVKRNELLSWLISAPGNPFVVYFTKNDIILSKRRNITLKEIEKYKYSIKDLTEIEIRNGILLDSIQFTFKDGKKIRIRDMAKDQGEPVKNIIDKGVTVFAAENLSNNQRLSSYNAYAIGDLIPKDIKINK